MRHCECMRVWQAFPEWSPREFFKYEAPPLDPSPSSMSLGPQIVHQSKKPGSLTVIPNPPNPKPHPHPHRTEPAGSRARVGKITTPHGVIHTPAFVPVGTNGALKAVDSRGADESGVQLMFCNTYHLLVHPGPDVVQKATCDP